MRKYTVEKRRIESGRRLMDVLILRPVSCRREASRTPGILWIHGGGYAVGMASMVYMSRALPLVKKYGAVVISPEYRLAGEAPYPAALDDCYAALRYLKENAESLGCNPDQIMVGGESAGGGLTASLCIYARDKGEINIAYQMPLYPMLDDRDTDSSKDNHGISWNTKRNHAAWKLYLRNVKNTIPAYAAPARTTDFSNLPPAYSFVGEREAFYCETVTYMENLKKAGVFSKLDIYPIGFHAFDMLLPFLKISRVAAKAFEDQYLYAAEHYFAPQKKGRDKCMDISTHICDRIEMEFVF